MKPKIVLVRGDYSAPAYYRLFLPYQALRDKGYPVKMDDLEIDDLNKAEIIVFQRLVKIEAMEEVKRLKQSGKKIVFDFDDDYLNLDPFSPAKKAFTYNVVESLKSLIRMADAITVTTPYLKKTYSRLNENVYITPNSLSESALKLESNQGDKLIIGWQGSPSHQEDLKFLESVLRNIRSKHEFKIVLFGFDPRFKMIDYSYRPWINFSDNLEYYQFFADFSIGVCPLKNTVFNQGKSDIKFLEYSALGIPTVATKIAPYETIKHGETGFLAEITEEWEEYLTLLLLDEGLRKKLGGRAKEYVAAERTIKKNIHLWEEVYNSL